MSKSELNQLIHMANQIADNNTNFRGESEAVQVVTTHLKRFWARTMKQQIIDYVGSDGSELNPLARKAVARLAEQYT